MELKKLYTAVGRLERESNGCGHSCPVIVLGGERYMVDMQEMVVWTALNWRISKWDVRPAQLSWGHPHQWLRICTRRVRCQAGTQPADNDEAGYEAIP